MSIGQFRRFTYLITLKNQNSSQVLVSVKSEGIQKQLKQLGVLSFEVYQKEELFFLLIAVKPDLDGQKLSSILSNLKISWGILIEGNDTFSFDFKPLERIYELDQKVVYAPAEGQLKKHIAPYKRFVWTLSLEPSLINEYKRVHSIGKAWPEITSNMKSVGVKDMEIYLHENQAFLIMDTVEDFDMEIIGPKWQKLPREEEWQTYVAKFQRTDSKSSIQEKWQDMVAL